MLFNSMTFLFVFLPLVLFIFYLSKDKYKNFILTNIIKNTFSPGVLKCVN